MEKSDSKAHLSTIICLTNWFTLERFGSLLNETEVCSKHLKTSFANASYLEASISLLQKLRIGQENSHLLQ